MLSPPFTPLKVIFLILFAAVVWTYLIWQVRGHWVRYRRKREVIAEGGLGPTGLRRDRRTLILVIVVGGILIAVAYNLYVDHYGTPSARARLYEIKALIDTCMRYLMGGMGILLVLLVVLLWWNRDPSIRAAAKLALAAKHAEAEALIRAAIEDKGPSEKRLTVLGMLLMEQNRLEESLRHLQEAQRMAKRPVAAKNNCAIALWKMGRREEAAKLFDEVCDQVPNDFTAVCNSCLLLAEMGRETPALDRLQQAERIFASYDFKYTKAWVPLLEQCRKALPAAKGFPVILPEAGEPRNDART